MKASSKFWMMKTASGVLIAHTLSYTRKGAMDKVASMHGPHWPWRRLYRNGARLVHVNCREI